MFKIFVTCILSFVLLASNCFCKVDLIDPGNVLGDLDSRNRKVPSPTYSISETLYEAEVEGNNVFVLASYRVKILREGTLTIPLILDDVAIESTNVKKDITLIRIGKYYGLFIKAPGTYSAKLGFIKKVERVENRSTFSLNLPASVSSKLMLKIQGENLDIKVEPDVCILKKEVKGTTELTVFPGSAGRLKVSWIEIPEEKLAEKVVFAKNLSLIKISPGKMHLSGTVNYKIVDAKVEKLLIKIPESCTILKVRSRDIKSWFLRDDGILEVSLLKETDEDYKLLVEVEKEINEFIEENLSIPLLKPVEVKSEEGFVAISVEKSLRLKISKISGMSQIDRLELPDENIPEDVSLCYRYLKRPADLVVDIEKIKPKVELRNNIFVRVDRVQMKLLSLLEYNIEEAGVFRFRVRVRPFMKMVDFKAKDVENWVMEKVEDGAIFSFQLKKKALGKYKLLLKFEKPTGKKPVIEVPSIEAVDVKKEIGFIGLASSDELRIKIAGEENITPVNLSELIRIPGIDFTASCAYKYIKPPYKLSLILEEVPPIVNVETFNFASIGEGLLLSNSAFSFDIKYAGVDRFLIKLPQDALSVNITGRNIKSYEKQDERLWEVKLHSKVKGKYQLYSSFEEELEKISGEISLPEIEVLNCNRETGFYVIGPRTNIEIKPLATSGLIPIDVKELPQDKLSGVDIPIVLAYRFIKHPYEISVSASRHEDLSVLVAAVEHADATGCLTREGQCIIRSRYLVKNNKKQYLKLTLPSDSTLWSAFVDEKPVKPARANGDILIPIVKYKEDRSFPVEIIYASKVPRFRFVGKINLALPLIDIPVVNANMGIYLPEKYLYRFSGNMKRELQPVSGTVYGLSIKSMEVSKAVPARQAPGVRGGKRKEYKRVADEQRREIQKEELQDKLFLSNIKSQVARYKEARLPGKKLAQVQHGKAKGVLPIRVDIPSAGKFFAFRTPISSETLNVGITYMRWFSLRGFLITAGFAVILFVVYIKQARSGRSRNFQQPSSLTNETSKSTAGDN